MRIINLLNVVDLQGRKFSKMVCDGSHHLQHYGLFLSNTWLNVLLKIILHFIFFSYHTHNS